MPLVLCLCHDQTCWVWSALALLVSALHGHHWPICCPFLFAVCAQLRLAEAQHEAEELGAELELREAVVSELAAEVGRVRCQLQWLVSSNGEDGPGSMQAAGGSLMALADLLAVVDA
jgi:hypothetical protein